MRNAKTVAALEASRSSVDYPQDVSWRFTQYRSQLLSVLAENGLSFSGWDWSESTQEWFATHLEMAAVGTFIGRFERNITLDPNKPLADEIVRLANERDAFKLACARSLSQQALGLK